MYIPSKRDWLLINLHGYKVDCNNNHELHRLFLLSCIHFRQCIRTSRSGDGINLTLVVLLERTVVCFAGFGCNPCGVIWNCPTPM